jgi:hypothetical protein
MYKSVGIAFFAAIFLTGCSSMLPKSEKSAPIYWEKHSEVEEAYKLVEPGKTTRLQLKAIGFDYRRKPNAKQIDYFEVRKLFLGPNAEANREAWEALPDRIKECLNVKELCVGQIFVMELIKDKQEGNFIANKTDTKVTKRTTGWYVEIHFLLVRKKTDLDDDDDLVVYKRKPTENPNINKVETNTDPLGWAKFGAGIAVNAIKKALCFGFC